MGVDWSAGLPLHSLIKGLVQLTKIKIERDKNKTSLTLTSSGTMLIVLWYSICLLDFCLHPNTMEVSRISFVVLTALKNYISKITLKHLTAASLYRNNGLVTLDYPQILLFIETTFNRSNSKLHSPPLY